MILDNGQGLNISSITRSINGVDIEHDDQRGSGSREKLKMNNNAHYLEDLKYETGNNSTTHGLLLLDHYYFQMIQLKYTRLWVLIL